VRVYRSVVPGVESLPGDLHLPRHRHARGYATVVLAGRFVEASFAGRFSVGPGDVLVHGPFDCHANDARDRGRVQILRLPWSGGAPEGRFAVDDPDALARIAARDPVEAEEALREGLRAPPSRAPGDWPEELAADLGSGSDLRLGDWARRRGLAPETVSRGFRRAFGVAPRTFRLESRARRAWERIVTSPVPLTTLAHEIGFADLAHMSRSVRALTSFAPSAWRSDASLEGLVGRVRQVRSRHAREPRPP
jgi:AraC-like DNA-binding protein